MTMNYCGRCGSANGTQARFCRQCGVELSSQAAFSSPAAPLNVEFSLKPGMKELQEQSPLISHRERDQGADQDPLAISKSLRRVRASGSLIIEASKKQQEQMNEIIAQAIEGFDTTCDQSPQSDQTVNAGDGIDLPAQVASRRISRPFAASITVSNPSAMSHTGQLAPNGPSIVLAQASGLNRKPGFGSKFRVGLIVLGLLLATGTYFVFRDRLLTPARFDNSERDLMRVEDQSAQYIQLGEHDREQGNHESAHEYFQRALALTPNNPNVHFLIAQVHSNTGQLDEAMKGYKALLRIAPEHLEARLQVAEIYRARGNWNAAYQEYQRIIALDQNSPQAAAALESIEAHQAGLPDPAAVNSSAARRPRAVPRKTPVLPSLTSTQAQVSLLPQRMGPAQSIKPPTEMNSDKSEDTPDPRAMAETRKKLGIRYFNVREYRAAINEFLAALRLTPEDKDIYYFLGSSYYGLGQYALAHDYYKRVDRGQYVPVAQSGAQKTEKAARQEDKRRENMLKNELKNEIKSE